MNILDGLSNDTNYRVLLVWALEETRGSAHSVLEMGLGGSTQYTHELCRDEGRHLVSIEEDFGNVMEYRSRFANDKHEIMCCSWSAAPLEGNLWSVALLDHAPGDRRWADAMRLKDRCEIIVMHDTEPAAEYGYGYNQIWSEFKYRVDVKSDGAWATAVSNTRDLSKWRGQKCGPYVITGPDQDYKLDPTAEKIRKFLTQPIERE